MPNSGVMVTENVVQLLNAATYSLGKKLMTKVCATTLNGKLRIHN